MRIKCDICGDTFNSQEEEMHHADNGKTVCDSCRDSVPVYKVSLSSFINEYFADADLGQESVMTKHYKTRAEALERLFEMMKGCGWNLETLIERK